LLAPLFLVCSCGDFVLFGDEDSDGTVEAVVVVSNEEPAACNTEEVTLDGTESYGDDLVYSWSLTVPDDSESYVEDDDTDETSFTPDKPGTYYVSLAVWDEDGNSDYVTTTVVAADPPIADADADPSIVCVGEEEVFDGSGSKDPNPTDDDYECSYETLSFSWELTSVPEGSESELDVSDSVYPLLKPDVSGTYTATLTVTRDGDGASSEEVVAVTAEECD
jgi:hypothetical protein